MRVSMDDVSAGPGTPYQRLEDDRVVTVLDGNRHGCFQRAVLRMMGIRFTWGDDVSPESPTDKAWQTLRELERLLPGLAAQMTEAERVARVNREAARGFMQESPPNKIRAKVCAVAAIRNTKRLEELAAFQMNVEESLLRVRQASSIRPFMDAMGRTNDAIDAVLNGVDLERVQSMMVDMQMQHERVQEVTEAMTQPVDGSADTEVELQLAAAEDESVASFLEELVAEQSPVHLPAPPTTPVEEVSVSKTKVLEIN